MTRLLGLALALVMVFAAIVMAITMADLDGTPTCAAVRSGAATVPSDRQCFEGSAGRKSVVFGFGIAGTVSAAAAAIIATAFALDGRRGRPLAVVVALALALSGLSILIGAA
jgi:hypothetical protein